MLVHVSVLALQVCQSSNATQLQPAHAYSRNIGDILFDTIGSVCITDLTAENFAGMAAISMTLDTSIDML